MLIEISKTILIEMYHYNDKFTSQHIVFFLLMATTSFYTMNKLNNFQLFPYFNHLNHFIIDVFSPIIEYWLIY